MKLREKSSKSPWTRYAWIDWRHGDDAEDELLPKVLGCVCFAWLVILLAIQTGLQMEGKWVPKITESEMDSDIFPCGPIGAPILWPISVTFNPNPERIRFLWL